MNERSKGFGFSEGEGDQQIFLDTSSTRRHRGGVTTARGSIGQQETLFTARQTPDGKGIIKHAVTPRLNSKGNLVGFDVKPL